METIRVDILNPKARKLLNDLMELKLIRISEEAPTDKQVKRSTSVSEPPIEYNGKQIRAVLEELAQEGGISSIKNPSDWQREQRKDRKLR